MISGDDATLTVLCEHLIADHFDVLPEPSSADALRLCRYNRPDVLALGLSLPDMGGIDVPGSRRHRLANRPEPWLEHRHRHVRHLPRASEPPTRTSSID